MVSFGGKAVTGWEDEIHDVAIQYMNAKVCFYQERPATVPYDPITGDGGEDGIDIIWSGKARVQQLRTPREFTTPYQASASRNFRFQLDPDDSVPWLYEGVKARVTDGGRDDALTSYLFVVNSAINSSHEAVRTIELNSNMRPTVWSWGPPPEPSENPVFPAMMLFPSEELFPTGV